MSDIVIKVEGLSKLYHLGELHKQANSFREKVTQSFSRLINPQKFKKSNPTPYALSPMPSSPDDSIWALKDVSFEVKRGEVLGIIGRNGVGKSTLLKILSRITKPTEGKAWINGRVGSLLEVGTGFHPELTGRENIYLNGAILGMSKAEIRRKLDEIVAFAEIENFINTPVKRYSSGMYVRLAFAVAAHLETEVLLVDEVLAVGDIGFQKKCLGKIENVASQGRTVLFVSHNMGTVRSLCNRSILFLDGKIMVDDEANRVISSYLSSMIPGRGTKAEIHWGERGDAPGCDEIELQSVRVLDSRGNVRGVFETPMAICLEITYEVHKPLRGMRFVLSLITSDGTVAFASTDHNQRPAETKTGRYRTRVSIPGGLLNRSTYFVRLRAGIPGVKVLIPSQEFLSFTCLDGNIHGSYFPEKWPGVVSPKLLWKTCREGR